LAAVAPLLVGVAPFGLVFGAAAVDNGFTLLEVAGSSVLVFAGASQIAIVDLLADGATVPIAVLTACVINLRMLMYSASLAPYYADAGLPARLGAAYLLTDQAYVVSVTRYREGMDLRARLAFYFAAGLALWVTWQITTVTGGLTGELLPDRVPLEFAIPLVFLSLLVGTLGPRPSLIAAGVGAVASVAVAAAGIPELAVLLGAAAGIAAAMLASDPPVPAGTTDAPGAPDADEGLGTTEAPS
jgi:predicted branched-subunit amino acid permease